MSTAPAYANLVRAELRQLERSRQALEHALILTRREEERLAAGLGVAAKRCLNSAYGAVDSADAGIARRLADDLDAVYTAAAKALSACWDRLRAVLKKALAEVRAELDRRRRLLRQLDGVPSA